MSTHTKSTGFTVIELMIGMLAMAVMALTVGSMLYFGWLGWRRSNEIVNMQRDASLALRVMAKEIRMSSIDDIIEGNPLVCENANGTATFTGSGGNLDVSGSISMRLVRGWVGSFNTVKQTDGTNSWIEITLNLNTETDQNNNALKISPRN